MRTTVLAKPNRVPVARIQPPTPIHRMKKLLPSILALLLFGCSREPAPVAPTSSGVAERKIADLEGRISTLEQMIRTLDQRDGRIADMAKASASNSSAPAPASAPRPDGNDRTREQIQSIDADIRQINETLTTLTEQFAGFSEDMAGDVEEAQSTLNTHEQVIEQILSGN